MQKINKFKLMNNIRTLINKHKQPVTENKKNYRISYNINMLENNVLIELKELFKTSNLINKNEYINAINNIIKNKIKPTYWITFYSNKINGLTNITLEQF